MATLTKSEVNKLLLDEKLLNEVKATRAYKPRVTKRPSFEKLFTEYIVEGKTANTLAKKYGVTPTTVRRWFSDMKRARLEQLRTEEKTGVSA